MFHLYIALGFVFLLWRFIGPMKVHKPFKWFIATIFLFISQYHLIQIQIFGTMFSPELPRWLVILLGWAFCTFVLIVAITLIKDLLSLVLFFINKRKKWAVHRHNVCSVITLLLSTSFAGIGVNNAIQVPKVRKLDLTLHEWPIDLNGLRVVQLTDLHVSTLFPESWTQSVVKQVNALDPDVILITGDFIDGTVQDRDKDIQPLKNLKARYGTYGVLGNHEYYFNAMDWNKHFEMLGITILNNEHRTLNIRDSLLTLAGVTDESAKQFDLPTPDIPTALKNVPSSVPIILMKHQPSDAALADKQGVALQLSGHTHGGMILGLNQIAKYANQGFISGLYQLPTMQLYVSNGAALWNGFPIRLGVPAEITEFTLYLSK
ncbi:metallophosphoesterase [Vibrio fluvialis]|nr:metallophosphoesterase [Vibrio fluvialis]